MMRNIDLIREVTASASHRWLEVLASVGINVPDSPRAQVACPACGGKDRFRFDDHGRGAHICNQCGAGDGLELIKKVKQCSATDAAKFVAEALGIDYRASRKANDTASQREKPLKVDPVQHVTSNFSRVTYEPLNAAQAQYRDTLAQQEKQQSFVERYSKLQAQTVTGESDYLKGKGLVGFPIPLLPDGALLIPLTDADGVITGAQMITSQGEKRLVVDSCKKGSYYAINAPKQIDTVFIAEGLATALSVHLMYPDALTVVAIDAGNLLPVAKVFTQERQQNSSRITAKSVDKNIAVKLILAADNDHKVGSSNIGKTAAENSAIAVNGWVSMPPTDHKADWNDYHQQYGLEAAREAFTTSMYQPQGKSVTPQLQVIESGSLYLENKTINLAQMAASQKAKLLAEQLGTLAVNPDAQTVYRYDAGIWLKLSDSTLEREMVNIFDEHCAHYSEKGIKSIVATMKLQLSPMAEPHHELIGFENGVYNLTTQTFGQHSPENGLINHNGITYIQPQTDEKLATHAPYFSQWLHHVTAGDTQKADRINAALFMVLANRHDWQMFIEVTGEGGEW